MKKSSEFIDKSVLKTNLKYLDLENKTKELYFRCLNESRSEEYFNEELNKIWGKISHKFMDEDIEAYRQLIHENNLELLEIAEPKTKEEAKKANNFLKLVAVSVIVGYEAKFIKQKKKEYKRAKKSVAYKEGKDTYLKLKVQRYSDGIVPYYVKKTGKVRYVDLNTYAAMIHNTNLTRSGWNETLADADRYRVNEFIIPYHNFSCPHCMEHQNRVYTRDQVEDLIGIEAEEQTGDILHPNCKCTLQFYRRGLGIKPQSDWYMSDGEKEELYKDRQKMNSLTLKKERLNTDIKIQEELGNLDEVDKLKQQKRKIGSKITEIKASLPTAELKKQVVAIKRNY